MELHSVKDHAKAHHAKAHNAHTHMPWSRGEGLASFHRAIRSPGHVHRRRGAEHPHERRIKVARHDVHNIHNICTNNGARSWRPPPTPPPRSERPQPPPTRARQVAWTQGHQNNGARRRCGNTIQERGLQGVHTAMPLLRHLGTRRSSEAARTSIGSLTTCWTADLKFRSP